VFLYMCVCVCVCVCICIYVDIFLYVDIYIYIHTHTHIHIGMASRRYRCRCTHNSRFSYKRECISMKNSQIVSITGVPPLQEIAIVGDYLLTDTIVNGHPLFVKVNSDLSWSPDSLCIRMSLDRKFWSVNPCYDAFDGKWNLCQIIIPHGCNHALQDVAAHPDVRARTPRDPGASI